jgi:O-antigen ligase
MERLTFNVGSSRRGPVVVSSRQAARLTARPAASRVAAIKRTLAEARERYDWDYLWMLAFTMLLFFRPQDHIRALGALHLSELTAIAGLAAMAARRLRSGLTVVKVNAEVIAVVMLGAVIVLTIPFSIWPGGSLKVFSDIYVKIILIFALMISTLTSPRRVRQMTWVMIVASGYIAARGIFDYVRSVNLIEGDRLRGAIGGMFENPNDLALNLVTFLAPTLFIVIQDKKPSRRLFAALLAVLMLGAIVATKSRSGFLGLVAMGLVVVYYTARAKPAIVGGVLMAGLLALPVMPSSFWNRMDGIINADSDISGSRAARVRLLNQGMEVFADNPLTGIGAGQFQNYSGPGIVERWRVTHNVWLQVAAELGLFGLLTFLYLVVRAYTANFRVLRMLRLPRRRRGEPAAADPLGLTPGERVILDTNGKGMIAALVGWTVCSFFASVAFNWTFYYVLALSVAGREIVTSRRPEPEPATEPSTVPAPRLVRVHA